MAKQKTTKKKTARPRPSYKTLYVNQVNIAQRAKDRYDDAFSELTRLRDVLADHGKHVVDEMAANDVAVNYVLTPMEYESYRCYLAANVFVTDDECGRLNGFDLLTWRGKPVLEQKL